MALPFTHPATEATHTVSLALNLLDFGKPYCLNLYAKVSQQYIGILAFVYKKWCVNLGAWP